MDITQQKNCVTHKFSYIDPRIAFFDRHAPNWDTSGPDPAQTVQRLNELRDKLALKSGQDVIEIGCGTGQITGWLADLVKPGRVVAIDFSPAMLKRALNKNIKADFVLMDICSEVPFSDCFDVALCFHSFPHFRDKGKALSNIYKMLKIGGSLIVMHLCGSAQLNEFHKNVGDVVGSDYLPGLREWDELLKSAKLNIAEAEDRPDLFFVRAYK